MQGWIRQRRKKISMVMQQDFSDIGIHHFPERYYLIRQIDGTSEKDYMEKNQPADSGFLNMRNSAIR